MIFAFESRQPRHKAIIQYGRTDGTTAEVDELKFWGRYDGNTHSIIKPDLTSLVLEGQEGYFWKYNEGYFVSASIL